MTTPRHRLATPVLTAVLALALGPALAGCGGEETPETAVAGTPSPTQETVDPDDADGVEGVEVVLVTGTAVGGEVTEDAVPVEDGAALEEFLAQFDPAFADEVRARAGRVDDGEAQGLLAQVVAVGCEVPSTASLQGTRIVAEVPRTDEECVAPVTTVALARS